MTITKRQDMIVRMARMCQHNPTMVELAGRLMAGEMPVMAQKIMTEDEIAASDRIEWENWERLKMICGVQEPDAENKVRVLRTVGRPGGSIVEDVWKFEAGEGEGEGDVSMCAVWAEVRREELAQLKTYTPGQYLRSAALYLLRNARVHLMADPRIRPDHDDGVYGEYVFDETTAPFIMQRRRSSIARNTRRGMANVIICCDEGFERMKLNTEKGHEFLKNQNIRVVKFRTGEVVDEPFAAIGYKGGNYLTTNPETGEQELPKTNAYDSGLILAHDGQGHGMFALNRTDIYWTRLV